MPRLEEPARRKATLDRRALLLAAPAGLLAACEQKMPETVATTPKVDIEGLTKAIRGVAAAAKPALLGVGLINLESGETFVVRGDRRFPMQSVFKLPLAAAVLAEIDAGRTAFADAVDIEEDQLSPAFSPIAEAWPGRRAYTLRELFEALVLDSDNTAADVLMKRIGGPGAVTAWLISRHVEAIRVDRYERELQPEVYGMPSFRPAWLKGGGFQQARAAVPAADRLAAMRAYMADPRDTATPLGMVEFLQMLHRGELVSAASTKLLLQLMTQTRRGNDRIKAGLPKTAVLAHRPGTSGVDQGISTAHNDVGVFTLADRRSYALAVFLSGSTLDDAGRDRIIAEVARAAVRAAG